MYASYLLDKDTAMYPNSGRHPAQTLNCQLPGSPSYLPPPPYGDFTGYHHVFSTGDPFSSQVTGTWTSAYAAPREEWQTYAPGAGFPGSSLGSGPELSGMLPSSGGESVPLFGVSPRQNSPPSSPRRKSYEWIRQNGHPSDSGGKTRTKDKYRVVYTDQQRLELEREYQYSRYITIRRKAELAQDLSLSERQVKIWFQNRRAKERKVIKKKLQLSQHATTTTPTPTAPTGHTNPTETANPGSSLPTDTIPVKEKF